MDCHDQAKIILSKRIYTFRTNMNMKELLNKFTKNHKVERKEQKEKRKNVLISM